MLFRCLTSHTGKCLDNSAKERNTHAEQVSHSSSSSPLTHTLLSRLGSRTSPHGPTGTTLRKLRGSSCSSILPTTSESWTGHSQQISRALPRRAYTGPPLFHSPPPPSSSLHLLLPSPSSSSLLLPLPPPSAPSPSFRNHQAIAIFRAYNESKSGWLTQGEFVKAQSRWSRLHGANIPSRPVTAGKQQKPSVPWRFSQTTFVRRILPHSRLSPPFVPLRSSPRSQALPQEDRPLCLLQAPAGRQGGRPLDGPSRPGVVAGEREEGGGRDTGQQAQAHPLPRRQAALAAEGGRSSLTDGWLRWTTGGYERVEPGAARDQTGEARSCAAAEGDEAGGGC
eukprot:768612-Hanusia_phi.AAC.8